MITSNRDVLWTHSVSSALSGLLALMRWPSAPGSRADAYVDKDPSANLTLFAVGFDLSVMDVLLEPRLSEAIFNLIGKEFPTLTEFPDPCRKFPVLAPEIPCSLIREFGQKPRNHWARGPSDARSCPKIAKFPVLFPVSRELRCRDGFDSDCVRHHAFFRTVIFPGDCRIARHWWAFAPAARSPRRPFLA